MIVTATRRWGWSLYGVIGKDARWFLGYSRSLEPTRTKDEQVNAVMALVDDYAAKAREFGDLSNIASQARLEVEIAVNKLKEHS